MKFAMSKSQIALAALAALGSTGLATAPTPAAAAGKTPGTYVAGDFHNHTTCSDGSISMQKLVKKATGAAGDGWGLDWFVQAGHGGNGNRNCTLVEDASLATPAYPLTAQGPTTTWANSIGAASVKGQVGLINTSGVYTNNTTLLSSQASPNMWRWQSIQEFQYPLIEYLSAYKGVPLFIGVESVVAGHEHASMSVITGQIPVSLDTAILPTAPVSAPGTSRYPALGNANALAQWEYCFDRNDTDISRGGANNWNCAVSGSNSTGDVSWNTVAQKLTPLGTFNPVTNKYTNANIGTQGHLKTVEAIKWMAQNHATGSYYVPAHLERAGPFNPDGNNGFNVEHLRNFNNAAPASAFGFETQPGHGASANRGEYQVLRNGGYTCTGTLTNPGSTTTTTKPDGSVCTVTVAANGAATSTGTAVIDSVGGTTYGGTGVYGAQVGGVWDALLGEGRNFWFFASSDWHNRGSFGPDDRRSTQDFQPGEYQRNYTMVRKGSGNIRPQTVVNGLRTGNNFAASGQLIDRLAFVACASYAGPAMRSNSSVEALALTAATNNTDIDVAGCATMGEKLVVRPGADIVVSIVVRDPSGPNNSPYSFPNPSLKQIGRTQALDHPELDHIDVIRGMVTGYKTPGAADYSGEWPRNFNWLAADGTTPVNLSSVPAAAKNTTAAVIKTFTTGSGAGAWVSAGNDLLKMTFRIPAVQASQYVRLRGTNLPVGVPYETDPAGNPLSDLYTNQNDTTKLKIPCTTAGTNVPANGANWTSASGQIDGCPSHLPVVAGQKMVAFDVAAWSDLWFYSNPIYVQVNGSTTVAGVN